MFIYLQNVKVPTIRFEVMSFDKATMTAKLKGEYGAIITSDVSKESLEKRGYKFVKSEKQLPLSSSPPDGRIKPTIPAEDKDDTPAAKSKATSPMVAAEDDDEEAPPPPPKKKPKKVVVEDEEE
jgi:hypothetical protein